MFKNRLRHHLHTFIPALVSGLGFIVFIASTQPQQDKVLPLLIPFLLLFICVQQVVYLGLFKMRQKQRRIISIISAVSVLVMLLMSSLGQLSSSDALLIAIVGLLAVMYVKWAS